MSPVKPRSRAGVRGKNSESSMVAAVATGDERVLAVISARYSRAAEILAANGMKSVLDVGCSAGYGTNLLRERGFEVRGIEKNHEAVKAARRFYPGIEFIEADASNPGKAGFDALVALEVIEHVSDQRAAVGAWLSAIRKGGILIVSTPNYKFSKCGNEYHEKELSYDDLRGMLPGSAIEGFDFHYITTKPVTALFGGVAALKFRMHLNAVARHFPRLCNNFLAVMRKKS